MARTGSLSTKGVLKRLDAWMAPALCRLFPRVSRDFVGRGRLSPGEVRRILIVRPGGMGDAVLTLPMVSRLSEFFSGAEIDVLAEQRNAAVYRLEDPDRRIFRYDVAPAQTWRELRRRRYDLVIDTEQFHRLSTLFAVSCAPRFLCGFDTLGRRRFQTHSVPYSEREYEVRSFLALAEAVTGRMESFDPEATFLRLAPRWVEESGRVLCGRSERPLAALMVAAGAPERRWPAERFGDVARWLRGRGFDVVLIGGRDGVPGAAVVESRLERGGVLNLAGKADLGQTAGVLARCQVCVSPDTGVLHIAYALGVPTVGLFGSGLQGKWGPPGSRNRAINKGLPCSPCTRGGVTPPCPREHACMQAIGVDDVLVALSSLLDGAGAGTKAGERCV
ncbi:MAG: glycosyltransferase family 9 protein [Deltaproteobacteria bacterium]|nr:glycosyltransferase family 9 protein [Deltaproteobacteria bacterium]